MRAVALVPIVVDQWRRRLAFAMPYRCASELQWKNLTDDYDGGGCYDGGGGGGVGGGYGGCWWYYGRNTHSFEHDCLAAVAAVEVGKESDSVALYNRPWASWQRERVAGQQGRRSLSLVYHRSCG